jgi:aspartate aminotransferase-like enzyme
LKIIQEEGMNRRIKRHEICARAFYSAFEAIGLRIFTATEDRSHTVLGVLYPQGIDDTKFRTMLSERFGILIAGGFGTMKGSMFRVGSMGMINETLVTVTVNSIVQCLNHFGYRCDSTAALSSAWNVLDELRA